MNEKSNIILEKSYAFSLRIVKMYKFLTNEQREFILAKQVLRSGTSIGANINEAQSAESKSDFIHKMGIALKELRETRYWLNLLKDSDYLPIEAYNSIYEESGNLLNILQSIILSAKKNNKK